ncbi:MAG: TIGR03668 family PPOX class F420-dependent oxidoreductase [Actinomycetota bacterium]|nr:TIGR03668 family PPOX class F420-dependent oxidoreductase [Actinomycetota bacterium]
MTAGACSSLERLPAEAGRLVSEARRAVLATLSKSHRPHLVPVCFAVVGEEIVTAIDDKPKSTRRPARLKNIERDPTVTLLFDRWDENWSRLGWVMLEGEASIEPPGFASRELQDRYTQYAEDPPRGEVIVVRPKKLRWWTYE